LQFYSGGQGVECLNFEIKPIMQREVKKSKAKQSALSYVTVVVNLLERGGGECDVK